MREANIDGKKVLSLSISSQGISFVPVDKNGDTLMNAISWYDSRAIEEAAIIRKDYIPLTLFTHRKTNNFSCFPTNHGIKNTAGNYEKAFKFLMGLDFLLYRFSGQYTTDYSMASGTLCYDVVNRKWILNSLKSTILI